MMEGLVPQRQSETVVTAQMLNGFDTFISGQGLNADRFLNVYRLPATDGIRMDAFVDFGTVLSALEQASVATTNDALGLGFARANPRPPTELYHDLMACSSTLGDALRARSQRISLVVNGYATRLEPATGGAFYTWCGPKWFGPHRQFLDYTVTLLVLRVRTLLLEPDWYPSLIEMERAEPVDKTIFEQVLGTHLKFRSARTRIFLDNALLSRPLPTASAERYARLSAQADLLPLASDWRRSVTAAVSQTLVSNEGLASLDAGTVAQRLGLSSRSFQRALAKENTTFEKIRSRVRSRLAHHYLVDTDMSVTEIAMLLGYAETSIFSRAAVRWFGLSPSAIRRRDMRPMT
jgi:AraC-like DNA-binding protein